MKPLERYGPALVEYEGVADLTFPENSGIVYKGYFQAKQLTTGRIVIGFAPIVQDSGGATTTTRYVSSEPLFHGRDPDGWDITTCGQTSVLPIFGPLHPESPAHPACVFRAQYIKAKNQETSESDYGQARFLVSNLLWDDREKIPEPIRLRIGVFDVTVSPGDDYLEEADNINAVRGIAPTAEVLIKASDDSKLPLESYGDFMNDLVSVFRLVTGNKVDWYYAEASEVSTGTSVERLHKAAVTGPFSNTVRFRPLRRGVTSVPPKLKFEALAEAFLGDDKLVLDRGTLKELINYFVNACDETSYLEARGILASTLTELIVAKYTGTKKAQNVIEKDEFKKGALPALQKAIKSVVLPKLPKELQKSATDLLQGAYRRSFRKRLKLLTKGLNLQLDDKTCDRAVKVRNELVHEGRYLPVNGDDYGYSQYKLMIWLNLVALCRLTGYEGDLPWLTESNQLDV